MTREEAEIALQKQLEVSMNDWFRSLPDPRIQFVEEGDGDFVFSVGGCEFGVFKDTGNVAPLPMDGGEE